MPPSVRCASLMKKAGGPCLCSNLISSSRVALPLLLPATDEQLRVHTSQAQAYCLVWKQTYRKPSSDGTSGIDTDARIWPSYGVLQGPVAVHYEYAPADNAGEGAVDARPLLGQGAVDCKGWDDQQESQQDKQGAQLQHGSCARTPAVRRKAWEAGRGEPQGSKSNCLNAARQLPAVPFVPPVLSDVCGTP